MILKGYKTYSYKINCLNLIHEFQSQSDRVLAEIKR